MNFNNLEKYDLAKNYVDSAKIVWWFRFSKSEKKLMNTVIDQQIQMGTPLDLDVESRCNEFYAIP